MTYKMYMGTSSSKLGKILGIDPSSVATGWAVLECVNINKTSHIATGTIKMTKDMDFQSKLSYLHLEITKIINEYKPDAVIMEETYVNINPKTSLLLAQFRGAIALSVSLSGLSLRMIEPRLVKKAVSGSGGADKIQVQKMVKMLFPAVKIDSADQADAIAIAYSNPKF